MNTESTKYKSHKRKARTNEIQYGQKIRGGRACVDNPRDFAIAGTFSLDEKNQIERALADAGFTKSEFVRLLVLDALDKKKFPEKIYAGLTVEASQLYAKLAPLSSNLNQIAKQLNSRPAADPFTAFDTKRLKEQVFGLGDLLKALRAAIIRVRQK